MVIRTIALAGALALSGVEGLAFGLPDERKPVAAKCPLDGFEFTAYEVKSADYSGAWGGLDRDGCKHAFKTTPLEYMVWCCPACGFAGVKADFDAKNALSDADKQKLLGRLKPAAALRRGMKQDDIAGHAKFDLMAQVALLREAPPERAGVAWLYGSWCARQQGAIFLESYDEWLEMRREHGLEIPPLDLKNRNRAELELEVARKIEKKVGERREQEKRDLEIVKQADARIAELRKAASPDAEAIRREEQRRGDARGRLHHLALLRYTAMFLHRRHGELADALRWAEELSRAKGDNSVIDDAVEKTAKSIELERAYQRKAAEQYEKAIAGGKLEKRVAAEAAYLVGELHRRIGDRAKAAEWYRKAIAETENEKIRKAAEEQLKLVE